MLQTVYRLVRALFFTFVAFCSLQAAQIHELVLLEARWHVHENPKVVIADPDDGIPCATTPFWESLLEEHDRCPLWKRPYWLWRQPLDLAEHYDYIAIPFTLNALIYLIAGMTLGWTVWSALSAMLKGFWPRAPKISGVEVKTL